MKSVSLYDEDIGSFQSKHDHCYTVFSRYAAHLGEQIEQANSRQRPSVATSFSNPAPNGCRLPPCDTETFNGDYLRWPTFRDLFSAIYINNPRLSKVDKLFHLNAKTSGEAQAIVSESPLTNEGFQSAWANLVERFETRKLLVNSQLKVLFSLQPIAHESGAAIKKFQGTIQGCLTALKLHEVNTEHLGCILVFICASKLPKLTRALWEQSILRKRDISTWPEINTFLLDRFSILEALDEPEPRTSTKHPTATRLNSFESKLTSKPQVCKLCSRENHPIRVCPILFQMSVGDRGNYVKQSQLLCKRPST